VCENNKCAEYPAFFRWNVNKAPYVWIEKSYKDNDLQAELDKLTEVQRNVLSHMFGRAVFHKEQHVVYNGFRWNLCLESVVS